MRWHDAHWSAGGWVLMITLMVLFWVAIAAAVVWLVRSTQRSAPHPYPPPQLPPAPPAPIDPARRILDERFARGEISEEEYRHRRDVLAG